MPSTATDDLTSDASPFQHAFARAKEEHSKAATATDEQALGDGEASTDDEAAAETDTATDEQPAASATTKTATADTTLVSDEDFTTLSTTHANDPVALRKALEGVFTKKTQALAAQRKAVERFESYAPVLEAYESDPLALIRFLAEENGVELVTKDSTAKPATGTATTTETKTAVDGILDTFRQQLGPELEYLADGLAPAIKGLVESLTKSTVEEATKPLKAHTDQLLTKAAVEQTETVMKSFGDKRPDWKTHEPAMLALAQKIQPNGMTELEFLDHLYVVATRDAWEAGKDTRIAEEVKKALKKMEKGASTTETRQDSTPESQVRRAPAGPLSWRESYELAKQGVRVE